MFKIKLLVLASLFTFSIGTSLAKMLPYVPFTYHIGKKSFQVGAQGSYFSSASLFDIDGNEVELTEGDAFQKIDFDVEATYGVGKQLQISAGGRYRSLTSENIIQEDSASGFESFWTKFRYRFIPVNKWIYALELGYRITAYDNEFVPSGATLPADLALGDDGSEFYLQGMLTYKRSDTHFFSGKIAFRSPPNELSDEIPYALESAWKIDDYGILIGFEGIASIGNDEFTDTPSLKPRMNTGVSALFNSINRSYFAPVLGAGIGLDNWRIEGKIVPILSGTSIDKGTEFRLGVVWHSAGEHQDSEEVKKFKQYTIEASILKVSPRERFVQIDHGLANDVEKGMRFDIFQRDFLGGNKLVASGRVFEVSADKAIIKIEKKFRRIRIQKSFVARGF